MPAGSIVKTTITTGADSVPNVLTGSQFALITEPSVVSVGITVTPTAVATIGINAGNRIVVEAGTSPPVSTLMPKIPDDFYYTFAALPGEQIQVSLVCSAICTLRTVVQIAAA